MLDYTDLITLAIAFGLGLLVGLQREKKSPDMAGVRTFTLISILGVFAGFLTRDFDNPFIFPMFGIALSGLLITANILKAKGVEKPGVGQTTEVAALLMFAIGGYLVLGDQIIAVITGGGLAVLLYLKENIHGFINKLKNRDLAAIMTFAGISLVILPLLPNETYGPLDVLNPQNIWLMITLIVGISVIGYFIYKFVGKKTGIITNGILGGIISSTATTVSYSRKTRDVSSIYKLAAFIISVASAISVLRIIILIGIIMPIQLPLLILPLMMEFIVITTLCAILFYKINQEPGNEEMPEPQNPAQFKTALAFGLLYGLVLLAVAFTKEEFGNNALYVVSFISGLTDVNAITLSIAQQVGGGLEVSLAWRLIMLALVANLIFKGILVAIIGTPKLLKWTFISLGSSIIAGLLIIWLWPESWHL